jgi:hypothetical protein
VGAIPKRIRGSIVRRALLSGALALLSLGAQPALAAGPGDVVAVVGSTASTAQSAVPATSAVSANATAAASALPAQAAAAVPPPAPPAPAASAARVAQAAAAAVQRAQPPSASPASPAEPTRPAAEQVVTQAAEPPLGTAVKETGRRVAPGAPSGEGLPDRGASTRRVDEPAHGTLALASLGRILDGVVPLLAPVDPLVSQLQPVLAPVESLLGPAATLLRGAGAFGASVAHGTAAGGGAAPSAWQAPATALLAPPTTAWPQPGVRAPGVKPAVPAPPAASGARAPAVPTVGLAVDGRAADPGAARATQPPPPQPFGPMSGAATGAAAAASLFIPLVALLVLLALAAPKLLRRFDATPAILRPTPFACALDRPG